MNHGVWTINFLPLKIHHSLTIPKPASRPWSMDYHLNPLHLRPHYASDRRNFRGARQSKKNSDHHAPET